MWIFPRSVVRCRRRRRYFDPLHARHEHHFRPDQEPAGKAAKRVSKVGEDSICTPQATREQAIDLQSAIHPRVLRETPSFAAITLVAPGERFNAFEIFVTPTFFFASDFNSRTSAAVH